jgi:hypothetical protein
MTNAPALLRSLITYAIVVPLALLAGYLLTNPLTTSAFVFIGILAALLVFPLLVRFHYPWMLFGWSAAMYLFFIKGTPNLGQAMIGLSLMLSILERIMNPQRHFIRVPSITAPLMAFVLVIWITAKMNGGIGLHALGSDVYGGKKYIALFLGIAGYFALTSRPIPPEKAKLYGSLFLLGGITTVIGDLYPIAPSWMNIVFHFFPPSGGAIVSGFDLGVARLGGLGNGASVLYLWMLARYGLRGIFLGGKLWRPVLLIFFGFFGLMGGFRSTLFIMGFSFIFMFFSEKLYRTRMLGIFVLIGILGATLMVPLSDKLPLTFQRAMSFIPGLHVSTQAKAMADASTNWRIQMWTALLPQVPQHLLIGKGFAISPEDYNQMMTAGTGFTAVDAAGQGLALANDYHNGMLSVVLGFGVWGLIVLVWFMFAGVRVMYNNMRYGRAELYSFNAMLFVLFFYEMASYLCCFGGLSISGDMVLLTGPLGMSIALNHGMCRPAPKPVALVKTAGQRRIIPNLPVFQQ